MIIIYTVISLILSDEFLNQGARWAPDPDILNLMSDKIPLTLACKILSLSLHSGKILGGASAK